MIKTIWRFGQHPSPHMTALWRFEQTLSPLTKRHMIFERSQVSFFVKNAYFCTYTGSFIPTARYRYLQKLYFYSKHKLYQSSKVKVSAYMIMLRGTKFLDSFPFTKWEKKNLQKCTWTIKTNKITYNQRSCNNVNMGKCHAWQQNLNISQAPGAGSHGVSLKLHTHFLQNMLVLKRKSQATSKATWKKHTQHCLKVFLNQVLII